MNKEHPEDNAQSRFTAFWMIVAALMVFVIVTSFVLCFSSSQEDAAANKVEDGRAEERFKKLAEVKLAQQALLAEVAVVDKAENLVRIPVKDGMKLVLPILTAKKAGPTKVVVPGSPTSLKQSQAKPVAAEKTEAATKDGKGDANKADAKTPEKK